MNHEVMDENGDEVLEVSGFCLPVEEGHVEIVVCHWDDKVVRYHVSSSCLAKNDVLDKIRCVHSQQDKYLEKIEKPSKDLDIPLSKGFIHKRWDDVKAYQARSKDSVVIVCPSNRLVYKYPLGKLEYECLHYLYHCYQQLRPFAKQLRQSATPIGIELIINKPYFKFKKYNPALNRNEANERIIPLVDGVVRAIQELHDFGRAHLDIRLENICFSDDGEAVLVDLDRSVPKDTPSTECTFGRSTMYEVDNGKTWRAEQLDWRQLAIMIYFITNTRIDPKEYHGIEVKECHKFLCEMYSKGCYNSSLHEEWMDSKV